MVCSRFRSTLLLTAAALTLATPAFAQDDRRLDRVEKQVKELRAIVFQGRDTGQPVVVKPEGPDPQVTALEQRVSDLEQTLQKVNGGLDTLTHDVDEAKRAQASASQANADQIKALTDRVAKLEAQAAAPPPPPPPPAGGATGAPAEPAAVGSSSTAADAPAPPARVSEPEAYKAAKALLASGDYPGATAAFQDYLTRFPSSPRKAEGRYWLGEALFIQDSFPDAARAYAQALSGWPKTGWAPEATLKLAQSLQAMNRGDQACAAVGEFQRRYGAGASAGLKVRADAVRAKAKCGG